MPEPCPLACPLPCSTPSGSRRMARAASPPAPSAASGRGATTRCCSTATTPPTGRVVLVNGLEVWLETAAGQLRAELAALHPGRGLPGRAGADHGFQRPALAAVDLPHRGRHEVSQEVVACHGRGDVVLRWRLRSLPGTARLSVRPLLSGRDYHALHHENPGFAFAAEVTGARVLWRPYPGIPPISAIAADGSYRHEPELVPQLPVRCRARARPRLRRGSGLAGRVQLDPERSRGDDDAERGRGLAGRRPRLPVGHGGQAPPALHFSPAAERRCLRRAARPGQDHRRRLSLVHRLGTRHLHHAARLHDPARRAGSGAPDILLAWADAVSEGMLPNRFPDSGEQPEFNAVDASLWYVVAVHEFLLAARQPPARVTPAEAQVLLGAVERILKGYRDGTRFGIRMDEDGLLAAGVPGVQLTWMDAKVGDWVVTPRIGKPVEVQALWLNALKIGRGISKDWADIHCRALASFQLRFWNEQRGCLFDVVDVDHVPGRNDAAVRPNQILAVGGLPYQTLVEPYATRVVEAVERQLLTPLGLRSLAPGEPGYRAHYGGGVWERDSAYHQGHGLALADGSVRRGLAAGARQHARGEARGGHALPGAAPRASGCRGPRPYLRDRRRRAAAPAGAAVRSRPGRSASSCGRAGWSRTTARSRSRDPRPGRLRPSEPVSSRGRKTMLVKNRDGVTDAAASQACDQDRAAERRAGAPRRGHPGRAALEALGAVPQRAPVGHGARGLQPGRQRLGLLPARPGAPPRLPLGRGRPRRHQRRHPAAVPRAGALERARPDPEGAPVRPDQRRGQPRRGREGALLLPRRHADPLLPEDALQVPAAASSPTAGWSRRTAGAARTSPSSS